MNLSEFLEKWGKTLFETPLATPSHAEDPPELAEIRHAVLDEIRSKCYRAGAKKVFPYDLIRVSMRGVEESRAAVFSGRFFRQYLEREVQSSLRAEGTRFPEELRVDVAVATGLPQRDERWMMVEAASQERCPAGQRLARLVVSEGNANTAELGITKARTNIGREVDVYRDTSPNRGLYRRNDLAFVEDSDINRTVSREHAHIQYDRATGEYRLFNDRWYQRGAECGTWIVRDGMSSEVHRDARGARLEPGDEIRFGRAVVHFEVA
jgi:hypothetical protein